MGIEFWGWAGLTFLSLQGVDSFLNVVEGHVCEGPAGPPSVPPGGYLPWQVVEAVPERGSKRGSRVSVVPEPAAEFCQTGLDFAEVIRPGLLLAGLQGIQKSLGAG